MIDEKWVTKYLYWNWLVHHRLKTTPTENRNSSDLDTEPLDLPMKPSATNEQSKNPKTLAIHHPLSTMLLSIPFALAQDFWPTSRF